MTLLHTSTSPVSSRFGAAGRPASPARLVVVALLLGSAAFGALAQYKIVSPDGHVTYTDKPPTAGDLRANAGTAGSTTSGGAGGGAMPYEVRQASTHYPVALYASKSCVPCDQARQWLKGHGIPFSEYSVDTNGDITQLSQRFGDGTMPVVTIGSQTIKGFASADLQSYADAAGYPKQSRLSGYSWPAPVPLAPPTRVAVPSAVPAPPPSTQKIDLPAPSKNGIQF